MAGKLKPLVAGNWKMNGTSTALMELSLLAEMLGDVSPACEVMICPPATIAASTVNGAAGSKILIGGQDCHWNPSGAHTGDISAEMLKDCGCGAVIVGHSERRTDHKETDDIVRLKASAAYRAGLKAIICIGETFDERKSGKTLSVVSGQLKGSLPVGATSENTVIAYEPVWAIGTGLTPTTAEVAEVHSHIRAELCKMVPLEGADIRILYGGSVKPSNAAELLNVPHVNGALVGGASLTASDFMGIIKVYC